jgi:hypothetical protein
MRRKSLLAFVVGLFLLVMFSTWSMPLKAQSFYGGIAGTATDSSGAVVPGAEVTVRHARIAWLPVL